MSRFFENRIEKQHSARLFCSIIRQRLGRFYTKRIKQSSSNKDTSHNNFNKNSSAYSSNRNDDAGISRGSGNKYFTNEEMPPFNAVGLPYGTNYELFRLVRNIMRARFMVQYRTETRVPRFL